MKKNREGFSIVVVVLVMIFAINVVSIKNCLIEKNNIKIVKADSASTYIGSEVN